MKFILLSSHRSKERDLELAGWVALKFPVVIMEEDTKEVDLQGVRGVKRTSRAGPEPEVEPKFHRGG